MYVCRFYNLHLNVLSAFKFPLSNIYQLLATVNKSNSLTRSIEARCYGVQERVLWC